MSKKQPVKPTATGTKQPVSQPNKKQSANDAAINISNKILIPAVILLFVALAFIYCQPLIQGMRLSTHDSNQYIALHKESADLKAATGHVTMWSSRMFGGMPSYLMGGIDFPKILDYTPRAILFKVLGHCPIRQWKFSCYLFALSSDFMF